MSVVLGPRPPLRSNSEDVLMTAVSHLNVQTSCWLPQHVAELQQTRAVTIPAVKPGDILPIDGDLFAWDPCPVEGSNGTAAKYRGQELWIALTAPYSALGPARHNQARLRLLMRTKTYWLDCGNLLPDGFSPGSREWAAVMKLSDSGQLTLFYTAAGERGEEKSTFRQRIFGATARLDAGEPAPRFTDWSNLGELVAADGDTYLVADDKEGAPGTIKAFRDPFIFTDTQTNNTFMLFSASSGRAKSSQNGLIGLAMQGADGIWSLQSPLLDGDGVTNEMERPHVVFHQGRYYLFWSTNGWLISADKPAPSGLYGMVSEHFLGPYRPINGSGLVVGNPVNSPYQAYSWWVSNDLSVAGFVDMLDGHIGTAEDSPSHPVGTFEGAIAPEFHLHLAGDTAQIVEQLEANA